MLGASKGAYGADEDAAGANEVFLALAFAPDVTINCMRGGCKYSFVGADEVAARAIKIVLAPNFC